MNDKDLNVCISCNRPEDVVPLVSITFAKNATWICTQCLPTLIHDPQKLVGKFENMATENPIEALN
jgi:hypothetical protein